jgi:hypothetical protein
MQSVRYLHSSAASVVDRSVLDEPMRVVTARLMWGDKFVTQRASGSGDHQCGRGTARDIGLVVNTAMFDARDAAEKP